MPSKAFNVYLGNKLIDTVFYSVSKGTIAENCEDVRQSLISHDAYDPNIRIVWPKGQRITETEYVIQGTIGTMAGKTKIQKTPGKMQSAV